MHLLNPLRAELLQPGDFRIEVVGVDVQVDAGFPLIEPLHQQPEVQAVQQRPVIFGEAALREFLAGSTPPERQLTVVIRGGDVDDNFKDPAEVRHARRP